MSYPQTKPHTYNEYETPPKWLIFIHYHDPKVPKLIRMTARILGDLSVILMQVSIPKDRENHVGASKTRWWQMRPDSQAKILTVETNLADLIKRAEHAERKGLGLAAK